MRNFLRNRYFKFGFVSVCYILWVTWIGNYWLLFGMGVVFDMYITRKVNWTFWKKRGVKKRSKLVEWIDALIFAVIAASLIRMFFIEAFTIPTSSMEKSLLVGDYLFVSKLSYGPKLPNTPLSIPFVPHTMPGSESVPSFLTWLQLPYKRIAGFGNIKRNDVVVFNFPEGDTVASREPWNQRSYYQLCRDFGREALWRDKHIFGKIVVRPVDKREFYIKRCVAVPGDTLLIVHGQVYINGKEQEHFRYMQYNYMIQTKNGTRINPKNFEKLSIAKDDYENRAAYDAYTSSYDLPLTEESRKIISGYANVSIVQKKEKADSVPSSYIFPHDPGIEWNEDNFGPLIVPKKGVSVKLSIENFPIYRRVIGHYEGNDLIVRGEKIFINGKEASEYTFKMNYYWMMGDNRHNSADSRYWGFVPEDHVVGKAVFVWLSLDKDKGWFDGKIRWSRMFRLIR
ncbi:MAG: signal peptidase I [Bacteroidetes bacterium]|nr:signal peptidase I [Bacteroidota bacterium]